MNIYHEMEKYFVGKSPEGDDRFRVPLKPDDDGLLGRECPNEECQPKYFKMSQIIPDEISKTIENLSQIEVTCPYCGTVDNMQNFHTESQVEWIKSMMFRDITETFQDNMKRAFKATSPKTKGMISFNLTFKPSPLPSVRRYVEEKLESSVDCDNCGYKYAVYGISFHCPLCGKGSLIQHLKKSAGIIRVLIDESSRIAKEKGREVGKQMIGNALEDIVTLFETFTKNIYEYQIKRRFSNKEAESMIKRIGTNFQRIEGSELLYSKNLKISIFSECKEDDKVFLEDQFLKRHVITHNLSMVDKKYIEKARTYQRQGAELDVNSTDVSRALEIVVSVVSVIMKTLQKIK